MMNKKKILSIVLVFCLFVCIIPIHSIVFADSWNGTYLDTSGYSLNDSELTISTANGFAYFSKQVQSGVPYSDIIVNLTADLNMSNKSFDGIGTIDNPFKGVFNGNGHTIINLNISGENAAGCFNSISDGASISNLNLSNVFVSNTSGGMHSALVGRVDGNSMIRISNCNVSGTTTINGSEDLGALIGCSNAPLAIDDCAVSNTTINASKGNSVGGLIGFCKETVSISDCSFSGTVLSPASKVGGILGHCVSGNNSISNCKSFGIISAKGSGIGGIVGFFENDGIFSFRNCTNYASVEGEQEVGGILGYSKGHSYFYSCVNNGPISATTDTKDNRIGSAGGILANNQDDELIFEDCVNTADINGKRSTGGICGDTGTSALSSFLRCYNWGKITDTCGQSAGICANSENKGLEKIECCINYGDVISNGNCGGIVNSNNTNILILRCSNYGAIHTTADYYCGGIASSNTGYTRECFNMGEISSESLEIASIGGIQGAKGKIVNCYNGGSIHTAKNVAGISAEDSEVINCYNYGIIKNGSLKIGQIACSCMIPYENCFCVGDDEIAAKTSQKEFQSNTMPELLNSNTFIFDTEKINNGFPILKWWNTVKSSIPDKTVSIDLEKYKALLISTKKDIPSDAVFFQNHYYKVYRNRLDWNIAQLECEDLGGYLATITSEEEQRFIESLNPGRVWIGALRNNDFEWSWVTGEQWDYTNWADNEPNNSSNVLANENRAVIWNPKWNDLNEANTMEQSGYICEWDISEASDSEKEVFFEKTYIADLWLKQKKGLSSYPEYDNIRMLLGFNCLSDDIASELADNWKFQAAVYTWDGLKTFFNQTDSIKKSLTKTQAYEALIFSLIEDVFAEDGNRIKNEMLTLVEEINTLTSGLKEYKDYIDKIDKIAYTPEKAYDVLRKTGIDKNSDLYKELSKGDVKSKWGDNNFLNGVNTIIESEETIAKFYDRFKGYVLAYNMGKEIQSFLEAMHENTSDTDLQKALDDIINACQNADYVKFNLTGNLAAEQGINIAKEFLKELFKQCDLYTVLKKIYDAESTLINLLLNTEGAIDSFKATVVTSSFVNAAKGAVYSTSSAYLNDRTEENAANYVFAVRTYRHAYIADLECALKFVKEATEEGLLYRSVNAGLKIAAYLYGEEVETTYEHMANNVDSIKKNLVFLFDELNKSWIYREDCLRADYPEIFSVYAAEDMSSEHFSPIIANAYVDSIGNTVLRYQQPLTWDDEITGETHYLYGAAYVDGLELTERYGDFYSEYEIENTESHPITTTPVDKGIFPREYSLTGYIDNNGEKIYTSATKVKISNPAKPPQIGLSINNDNSISIRVLDRTEISYTVKYHIYRMESSGKESEIVTLDRAKALPLRSFVSLYKDNSVVPGNDYFYRVVSEVLFNDGSSVLSAPSNTVEIKSGKLIQIDNLWVRETRPSTRPIAKSPAKKQNEIPVTEQYTLTLGWDSVGDLYRYQVLRKSDYSDEYVIIASDLGECEFCDTNVVDGVSYSYIVFACTQSDNVLKYEAYGSVEFASEKLEVMLGDVDGDGNISAADARLALRRSVGLETYEEGSPAFLSCDVDLDGNVSAADARLILRASVGLEDPKTWVK